MWTVLGIAVFLIAEAIVIFVSVNILCVKRRQIRFNKEYVQCLGKLEWRADTIDPFADTGIGEPISESMGYYVCNICGQSFDYRTRDYAEKFGHLAAKEGKI